MKVSNDPPPPKKKCRKMQVKIGKVFRYDTSFVSTNPFLSNIPELDVSGTLTFPFARHHFHELGGFMLELGLLRKLINCMN